MLRITFINVGYGDSILLEELEGSKRAFSMLVDAGTPFEGDYTRVYESHTDQRTAHDYLLKHGIDKLDIILLTHFHIDHVGGMPAVMQNIPFGEVWTNYRPNTPLPSSIDTRNPKFRLESLEMFRSLKLLEEMNNLAGTRGQELKVISSHKFGEILSRSLSADIFAVKPDLALEMERLVKIVCNGTAEEAESALYALDKTQNASCAALRINYKGRSALLAADLPHGYWTPLIEEGNSIKADILKFSHHGHNDGASPTFAKQVSPSHVVYCVSPDNPFGCPKPSALSVFPENVMLHSTGDINFPPRLPSMMPHSAVIFEISEDGELRWKTEKI